MTRISPALGDGSRRGTAPPGHGPAGRAGIVVVLLLVGLALAQPGCTATFPAATARTAPPSSAASEPTAAHPAGTSRTAPPSAARGATEPAASTAAPATAVPGEGPLIPQPPTALLSVNGRGDSAGQLGSYVFLGTGSDSPWLPARSLRPVPARGEARLSVRLSDGRLIGPWTADLAAAQDEQGATLTRLGGEESGRRPLSAVEVRAPDRGSWVLMVNVVFADGSGSAAYYWRIDVR